MGYQQKKLLFDVITLRFLEIYSKITVNSNGDGIDMSFFAKRIKMMMKKEN